jgi:hypothetical protein
VSFLPSADLTARLRQASEAPWQALELSMHKLAFLLKPYGVRPRQNDAKTARGYQAADFADPFRRYLTVQTVQLSAQAADQHECPDSSADTLPSGNCPPASPDASPKPDCPEKCPAVSAGQDGSADTWTLADGPAPGRWPQESIGAAANA